MEISHKRMQLSLHVVRRDNQPLEDRLVQKTSRLGVAGFCLGGRLCRSQRCLVFSREFGLFSILTIAFYTALWFFQWQLPVHVSTAPAEVAVLITLVIFLVASVTTYLSNASRHDLSW
jgi:hypothetical protein